MKYSPGLLVGELSGKAGSTVAAHNRNGAYLRTRAIPVNPNTAKQITQRDNFAAAAKAWKALSSTNLAGWRAAASLIVLYDRLGRPYTPTGLQYFVSCCRTIFVYDSTAALPTVPPASATPTAIASATVTCTSV